MNQNSPPSPYPWYMYQQTMNLLQNQQNSNKQQENNALGDQV